MKQKVSLIFCSQIVLGTAMPGKGRIVMGKTFVVPSVKAGEKKCIFFEQCRVKRHGPCTLSAFESCGIAVDSFQALIGKHRQNVERKETAEAGTSKCPLLEDGCPCSIS